MKNARVHVALISVSVLFGINYVVGKFLLEHLGPPAWAFCRSGLTGLILGAVFHSRLKKLTVKQWLSICIVSLFGVVINQVSFFEGLLRTTPTHSAVINTVVPILTLAFSVIRGQEKVNFWRILGMTLGVIGVLVVLEIDKLQFRSQYFIGDLLTIINACSFALYLVLSKKINREIKPLVVTAGMFVVGAVGIGFYGAPAAFRAPWLEQPWPVFAAILFSIVGATISTYYLNNWALSKVDSSAVAIYIYIQPIIAGLLSRFIFREALSARLIVSALLVFLGVGFGTLMPLKKKKEGIYVESHF